MSVQDPLRFGLEDDEDQLQQDVPLDVDEPDHTSPSTTQGAEGGSFQEPSTSAAAGVTEGNVREGPSAHFISPSSYSGNSRQGASSSGIQAVRGHSLTDTNREDLGLFGTASEEVLGVKSKPLYTITVSDPVKRSEEGMIPGLSSSHYDYLISSSSTEQRTRVEVRRRFKDVVALATLLSTKYRGYFLFPRPDKNTLEGQLGATDLVKSRVADITRYLNHLASHSIVGRGEELAVFLTAPGNLLNSLEWQGLSPLRNGGLLEGVARLPSQLLGTQPTLPSTTEATLNARDTNDLLRRFREMGERMRQEFGNSAPHLSEKEADLRNKKANIEAYLAKLSLASRKAEYLVKEFEGQGAVMGDLGMSLIKLANYEEAEGTRAGPYTDFGADARGIATESRRIGTAAVRCRRLARLAVSHLTEALVPLHDELALAPAAVAALKEREAALLTEHLIQEDREKKQQAAAALEEAGATRFGGNPSKARKFAQLENEIASAEAAIVAAHAEYEKVKSRNEEELVAWQAAKSADYARMSTSVALINTRCSERVAEILQAALDEAPQTLG
ncbi:VPS5B [Auxenochlorella protothecoides x Auxenochlorella symbiontica]